METWSKERDDDMHAQLGEHVARVMRETGATGVQLVVYWADDENSRQLHVIDRGAGPMSPAQVFTEMAQNYALINRTGLRLQ